MVSLNSRNSWQPEVRHWWLPTHGNTRKDQDHCQFPYSSIPWWHNRYCWRRICHEFSASLCLQSACPQSCVGHLMLPLLPRYRVILKSQHLPTACCQWPKMELPSLPLTSQNCRATAWVWWISPALKHVQGWRLAEALLCGPGCISFFFCSPSLASFTYPSFTTWPGPSKALHPTNAIYHKTQRHLIAPLQMAPAAQISLQHWSSGSQQS